MIIALIIVLMVSGLDQPKSGYANVIDGDTFELGGEPIRLWGVDAPERAQTCKNADGHDYPCGTMALEALRGLIGANTLTCIGVDQDAYQRVVARCRVNGTDLGSQLVSQGWAVDFITYSAGAYRSEQIEAQTNQRGLWSGSFDRPADFRSARNNTARSASPSPPRSADCLLKGNISASGEHIFHTPGQRDYDKTVIDPSRGERWFCVPAEAQTAGWRPAQR